MPDLATNESRKVLGRQSCLTARAVVHCLAGRITRAALCEMGIIAKRVQDRQESGVDLIAGESLAHKGFGYLQWQRRFGGVE